MLIKRKKRLPDQIQNSNMRKYFYYEAPTEIRASRGGRVDYSQSTNDDTQEETDNDTTSTPAVQASTTTIRASRGSRVDYSKSANDDTQETPTNDPPADNTQLEQPAPSDNSTDTENTDDTASSEPTTGADDIEGDDDQSADNTQTDEQSGEDGDVDYSDNVPQGDDDADQGGDDQDTDDQTGDGSDTTQDDSNSDQGDDGASTEQENPDQTQSDNDDGTQRRKYNLYRDYTQLYNSISSYIEKLEGSRPDNIESNIVINSVLSKLHRVRDSLYEYMVVKFESASYLASLMFFQQGIAVVRLCFGLIRNNKPFINQDIRIEDLDKKDDK